MRVFPEFEGPMAKWPRLEVVPYAKETLSLLHIDCIIGLATNAEDSRESEIRYALNQVGLNEFIDKIYCYQNIGFKKPSNAYFKYILNDLMLEPMDVCMIGDSYNEDVVGANQLGIRAVWFNHRSDEEISGGLYKTINDLRDLHRILDDWDIDSVSRH